METLSPGLEWLFPVSLVGASVFLLKAGVKLVHWGMSLRSCRCPGSWCRQDAFQGQREESKTVPLSGFSSDKWELWLPGEGREVVSSLLWKPLDPACGSFLILTLKYVLSENAWRKCPCKQVLSGNPAIVSEISWRNALSWAETADKGESRGVSVGGVCLLCWGNQFTPADLHHRLAASPTHQKTQSR